MRYLRILCICIIQLFLSAVAFAQTQVTGHVADVRGEDIIGANVTVKGTSNGTITDIDGNFNLANVPSSAKTLQISYIGMQTQEVVIKPTLKVLLKSDSQNLEEVVVTAMVLRRSLHSQDQLLSLRQIKSFPVPKNLLTRHCPVKWQVCAQPQQLVTQDLWPKSTFAVSVLSVLLKARCMLLTVS